MKRKTLTKLAACGLVGALTVGNFTVGVVAAPTAGITSYTTNIVTSSVLPTAGISLAMSECATTVEDEAVVASAQPEVKENETPVVASEYADIAVSTADNFVYIRKKASAESKALGKLYAKNVGTVLSKKGDWYKIKSGSVTGYVSSDYVKVGDEKLAKKAGRRVALVNTETLKVRTKASKKAEVIGLVPEGDDLTVVDESIDGWVGVSTEDGDGYVSSDYVALSTEYTYAESNAEEKARLKKEAEERKAGLQLQLQRQARRRMQQIVLPTAHQAVVLHLAHHQAIVLQIVHTLHQADQMVRQLQTMLASLLETHMCMVVQA